MSKPLRAARAALIAMAGLLAFFAVIFGLYWAAHELFGKWGMVALWLAMCFGLFWICAMLDIKGDRA